MDQEMTFHHIPLIFILVVAFNLSGGEIHNGNNVIHPAPVTGLHANAGVNTENNITIQFQLSWGLNKSSRVHPKDFNIHLNPLGDSWCQEVSHSYFYVTNKTNVKVPLTSESIFQLLPGCTYNIRIEANPHNGLDAATINYTLPECLGHICMCRHDVPPVRNLTASIVEDQVVLVWQWPEEDAEFPIKQFRISYGEQWKGKDIRYLDRTLTLDANGEDIEEITMGKFKMILSIDLENSKEYFVYIEPLDIRGCQGPFTNTTFALAHHMETKIPLFIDWHSRIIKIIFSLTSVIILCIVILYFCQPHLCIKKQLQSLNYDGSSQLNPLLRLATIEMKRSPLYIEREIVDARNAGIVDEWEISPNQLTMRQELGKGAFGRVYLATAACLPSSHGKPIEVAVKILGENINEDDANDMLAEIAMLKAVGQHRNVIALLGCITLQKPYCIILELAPGGELLRYLRALRDQYAAIQMNNNIRGPCHIPVNLIDKRRSRSYSENSGYLLPRNLKSDDNLNRPSLTETVYTIVSDGFSDTNDAIFEDNEVVIEERGVPRVPLEYTLDRHELHSFAMQIVQGMAHLESLQITHRDLAARNILLGPDKTIKISDFGLSRSGSIYITQKHCKLPLRWLSIEAIIEQRYSSFSDVWAFGVVLWEIGTLGGFPYLGIEDHHILPFLLKGSRLQKPDIICPELYKLMHNCWAHKAEERPTFANLVNILEQFIAHDKGYVDFSELNPEYVFPPIRQESSSPNLYKNNH